jgi:hypothetical protein
MEPSGRRLGGGMSVVVHAFMLRDCGAYWPMAIHLKGS